MTHEIAREQFVRMVRDCGQDIVRMRASFEMYLNQYLADYPDERQLLLDALKVGIPEKIIQHAGERDYAKYLAKLGPRFAEASKRLEEESIWAVETWAIALDRHADYMPPAELPDKLYPEDLLPPEAPETELVAKAAMAVIVMLGAFLGAALASALVPVAIYAAGFSVTMTTGHDSMRIKSEGDLFALFAIEGLVVACCAAAGALAGWQLGQGAERPWASFAVAFGAAITMTMVMTFFGGMIVKGIVLCTSVFGATYKSAARGGEY